MEDDLLLLSNYHESRAQQFLFTGLYMQGYKQQTEEQRQKGIGCRKIAVLEQQLADSARQSFCDNYQPANNDRYAGPFLWEEVTFE